jgi:membrane protease YdiL (CAAX protease family)
MLGSRQTQYIKLDRYAFIFFGLTLAFTPIFFVFGSNSGNAAEFDVGVAEVLFLVIGFIVMLALYFLRGLRFTVDTDYASGEKIFLWAGIALIIFLMLDQVVSAIPGLSDISTTPAFLTSLSLAIIAAVAEEFFFRGFLYNFFGYYAGRIGGIIASGASFMIYHLSVYQGNPAALAVVLAAGFVFPIIDLRAGGKLSASIIGHMANNLIAFTALAVFGSTVLLSPTL